MTDIVILSVPYTIIEVPPLALALLKGVAENEGFSCRTVDLGMELFEHCGRDKALFDQFQEHWMYPELEDGFEIKAMRDDFITLWAKKLIDMDAKWIGISVFSYYSHLSTWLLATELKRLKPDVKIVVGGLGIQTQIQDGMHKKYRITGVEKLLNYGEILKRRGLTDEFILGDGEEPLLDLLRGTALKGGYHMEPYNKQEYPFANFDDFNLSRYEGQLNKGYPQLPIFSSKGCVRDCDFCDVNATQNKFRFRIGKNIATEMIHLADRYGIRDFLFLDSLVNGSLKSLREWSSILAEHNVSNPDKRINWASCGWICRPVGQTPMDLYEKLALSGFDSVSIGVESGSNHVLEAMNKKTNVEALYFETEQFAKYNMKFVTLLLIGHWSERWEDFLETCHLMVNLARFARSGNFAAANIGVGFTINEGTPSDINREVNGLINENFLIWWSRANPALTLKERYWRLLLLERLVLEFRIPIMENIVPMLHRNLSMYYDNIVNFYDRMPIDETVRSDQHSEYWYENFDQFVPWLLEKNTRLKRNIDISLELESSVTNNDPARIRVMFNNDILFDNFVEEGICTIEAANLQPGTENCLRIEFSNKNPNDTIVDSEGNIVKDKFVTVKKFQINGMDIFKDVDFFYSNMVYEVDGVASTVSPGFWFNNSVMSLTFDDCFLLWYCRRSNKNTKLDAAIVTEATLPGKWKQTDAVLDQARQKLISMLKSLPY